MSIVAVLGSLALVAPATSAAKNSVSTSVSVDPSCGVVNVAGSWTPVSGQAYVGVDLSDNQTGLSSGSSFVGVGPTDTDSTVSLGGLFSPLAGGRHVLKTTFTVYDVNLNPLVSGKDSASMACALSPVILPT